MNMQYTKRIVTLIAGVAALGLATTAQAGLKEDLAEAASTFAVSRQHYLQAQQELGQALGVKADVTKKLAEAQKLTGSKNKKDQDKASALTAEAKKEIDAAMATAGALSDKQKEHLQKAGAAFAEGASKDALLTPKAVKLAEDAKKAVEAAKNAKGVGALKASKDAAELSTAAATLNTGLAMDVKEALALAPKMIALGKKNNVELPSVEGAMKALGGNP